MKRDFSSRSCAILLGAMLLAIPLTQGLPEFNRWAEAGTKVEIIHALSPQDDYPRLVAEETAYLLRGMGGLRKVQSTSAASPFAFLHEIRSTSAEALVLVAHGEEDGLRVGGELVPWADLRAALAQSPATDLFIGACHSERLGEVAGKRLRVTFDDVVDYRVVGPTIAEQLVRDMLPAINEEFQPKFMSYVNENGGLEAYALLSLFPREILMEPRDECTIGLEQWYNGSIPAADKHGCIVLISSHSTNCYSERDRMSAACTNFTAEQQASENEKSAPTGEGSWFDDCKPGELWACLEKFANFEASATSGAGTSTAHVRFGHVQPDDCFTLFLFHPPWVQGPMKKVAITVMEKIAPGKSFTKALKKADGPSIGVRLCGNVEGKVRGINPDHFVHFSGAGNLDVRASAQANAEIGVTIFGREVMLNFGVEGGIKYPFFPSIEAEVRWCPQYASFEYKSRAEIDGGGFTFFADTLTGFKHFGFAHNAGFSFHQGWDFTRQCAGGRSQSADAGALAPDALLPLGDAYGRLVDAGLAAVNERPTLVAVQEDGAEKYLTAMFIVVVPGTGQFNHLAETGVLDALGVPEDLPASQKALLDLTDRHVREAIGMSGVPDIVPRVSLAGGVALVPAGAPVGQPTQIFCSSLPGAYLVLEAKACEGISFEPIGPQPASHDLPVQPPIVPCGPIFQDPDSAPANATTEEDEYGTETRIAAGQGAPGRNSCVDVFEETKWIGADYCGPDPDNICQRYTHSVGKAGTVTQMWLAERIHNIFLLLERPPEAAIYLNNCPMGDPAVEGAGACLTLGSTYDDIIRHPDNATDQYVAGRELLAEYTTIIEEHYRREAQAACQKMKDTALWLFFGYGDPALTSAAPVDRDGGVTIAPSDLVTFPAGAPGLGDWKGLRGLTGWQMYYRQECPKEYKSFEEVTQDL